MTKRRDKKAALKFLKKSLKRHGCQSAPSLDPLSASKIDPLAYPGSGTVFEAPGLVAGFDDLAVMGEAVQERGDHFGIAKYCWPFADEGEVGGDDDGGALVELADQMEQQLPPGLGEGQIAKFVEDDEVQAVQVIGQAALFAAAGLGLEAVDQIDDIVEPPAGAVADQGAGNSDGKVRFAGSGAADQDDIALIGDEGAGGKVMDQARIDRCAGEVEVVQILGQRQFDNGELVADRSGLFLGDLGSQQVTDDAGWLVLALDAAAHDLVISTAHPIEVEAAHQVEDLGAFHMCWSELPPENRTVTEATI